MPELTIAEVARIAEGEVERGDPERTVHGVAPLDEAGPRDLSFVAEARYHAYIHASRAAAVLLARGAAVELPDGMAAVRVDDPRRALARILEVLYPAPRCGARRPSDGSAGRGGGGGSGGVRGRVRGGGGGDADRRARDGAPARGHRPRLRRSARTPSSIPT